MALGDPIGDDLCSGTTDGSTLAESPNYTEREISFGAGTALTSGTQYAICVRNSESASEDAFAIEGEIFPDADYAGGYFADSDDSGSSWSQDDWIDLWFKTKAEDVEKDTYTDDGYDLTNGYGTKWYSQIFTAGSDYTITSVILRLGQYGGGTPGTITVSIKAVSAAGSKAINPTPTDATDKVTLDQATLTWEDGGDSDTFNVYYGEDAGSLELVSEGQAELSFTISGADLGAPFDYTISRAWRIDSINDAGITTGDVWTFTTITFNVPSPGPRGYGGGGGGGAGAGEEGDFAGGAISDGQSNIKTRLISFTNNEVWYEDT